MAQHDHVILDSGDGLVVTLSPHGARIASVKWHGTEIVAGGAPDYAGAVCGRFANRIGGSRFTLDGVTHELSANEPGATLHGGKEGFDKRNWVPAHVERGTRFTLFSPDGDQGYPGGADRLDDLHARRRIAALDSRPKRPCRPSSTSPTTST